MSSSMLSLSGVLPYAAPGTSSSHVTLDVELGSLTLLLGPNGSGKTAVLEALGYAYVPLAPGDSSAASYVLVQTLRPTMRTPSPLYASIRRGDSYLHSVVYVEPLPLLVLADDRVLREATKLLGEDLGKKLWGLLREDVEAAQRLGLHPAGLRRIHRRRVNPDVLEKFIYEVLGGEVETAVASRFGRPRTRLPGDLRSVAETVLVAPRRLLLVYVVHGGEVEKAVIVEGGLGVLLARRRGGAVRDVPVAVFHPGFAYWRGFFESLYYHHISLRGGLPGESEAVELLRSYIPWFDGFEIVGFTLHVRTVEGRRIPVYSLSDGHRVAVFLGLLYASVTRPAIFLLDTPEAFMHPDGLGVTADLIARLAARGSRVVAASQSAEFTRHLLAAAEHHGLSAETLVEQVTLDREGRIKSVAAWSGSTALQAVESLGADLRLPYTT